MSTDYEADALTTTPFRRSPNFTSQQAFGTHAAVCTPDIKYKLELFYTALDIGTQN